MNDQPSPAARIEDDTPPSPKRKKVRAKYAPKACVSCRRSKLKCSGENPCSRCLDNGKRCFYSEDQTAAEALQNLSRPTPVQPPPPSLGTNGNGVSRRSILPRHEGIERRASDASVLGLSMEARMARMETMMETLIQERAMTATPRGSSERDDAVSDTLQGDFAMTMAGEVVHPSLAQVRSNSFKMESPERSRLSISAMAPFSATDPPATIRVGSRTFAFPNPIEYQRYLDFFFDHLNNYYPCINEADFRIRSEKMLVSRTIQSEDACLLALHYIMFACADIATDTSVPTFSAKPPGWQWFQAVDELVGKRCQSGQGDLSLIQCLTLETIYLTYADKANTAHNIIGIACRLCFQFGLHQQSSWRDYTPFEIHLRQRIFWTTYVLDRSLSLSCGRPYNIRESDIDIDQPSYLFDKDCHPDQPLPETDLLRSSNKFLNSMVCWSRLAADVWDGLFAAAVAKRGFNAENALILDARIKHWTEVVLPTIPLLPTDRPSEVGQLRQHALIHTRLSSLRLLLFRQLMHSLDYDGERGRLCGELAIDIVQRIGAFALDEAQQPSSFRFYMATSLSGALLVLTTLLVRDLSSIGLQDVWKAYAHRFSEALAILQDMSMRHAIARRILDDFKDITPIVSAIVDHQQQGQQFPQHLVPRNVKNLLPYTSLDFAQQSTSGEIDVDRRLANDADVLFGQDTDLWDLDGLRKGKYGVPWI